MSEEEIINEIISNFNSLDYDSKKYLLQNSIKQNIMKLCRLQKVACKVTQVRALYKSL